MTLADDESANRQFTLWGHNEVEVRPAVRPAGRAFPALILAVSAFAYQASAQAAVREPATHRQATQKWCVQVESVDTDDLSLDPSFEAAIYASLLEELAKTKQFKQVFRNGDLRPYQTIDVLVLKTKIQTDPPEVRIQLYTQDGRIVLDQGITDHVQFSDTNPRSIRKLAHNLATALKNSALPKPTALARDDETVKAAEYQVATITAVESHFAPDGGQTAVASYDVLLKVGGVIYVVLYAPPLGGVDTIRYGVGGKVRVLVGDRAITFNDDFGNSFEAPILSKTTTAAANNH